MNKKLLPLSIISIILLFSIFYIQPRIASSFTSSKRMVAYNRICPTGEIYQGDTVLFGGSLFNNESIKMLLVDFAVEFYNEILFGNLTKPYYSYSYTFNGEDPRNTLMTYDTRTFAFEQTVGKELPVEVNYTIILKISFEGESDQQIPDIKQIGENASLDILIKRPTAPNYIYIVFVLLLIGILAFVVVGLVGWIRERRKK